MYSFKREEYFNVIGKRVWRAVTTLKISKHITGTRRLKIPSQNNPSGCRAGKGQTTADFDGLEYSRNLR